MSKKLFFLAFALLTCNALFSQDPFNLDDSNNRDKPFRIAAGVKVGGGLATATDPTVITTAYPAGYTIDFKNGLALQAGAVGNIHFGRREKDISPGGTGWTGLQAEVLYGYRSIGTENGSLGMHCIEIPVLFQVYPITALAIEAGATFVSVLKCSPESLQFNGFSLNTGQFVGSNDIMISAGVSYKIPAGLMFGIRYNLGTSSLAGNFDSKVSSLMASFAYLFTFGK